MHNKKIANVFHVILAGLAIFSVVAGETEEEEKRRIKSIILNEDQQTTIRCPENLVLRIKTAQYRIVDKFVCPSGTSTCRNKCPGSFISYNLAKRCDLQKSCTVRARPSSQRDSCSDKPEPLAILYTCNNQEQAKTPGNPSEDFMAILQSAMCSFQKFMRFCQF